MIEGKVVLTGAGGRIGSRLGVRLRDLGYDLIGLDRRPPEGNAFPWRYAELSDRESVMRNLEGATAVVHLGEIPSMWGPFSPDEVFSANTRVGSTVFQSAAYLGVTKIVYASTAQVYGSWGDVRVPPVDLPLDEDHPLQPQNAYAQSKVANEGYLRMLIRQRPHMAAACLRFPGVIGIWRSWEVFVDHLHAHLNDMDGLGTYIHIDDLCEAFVMTLEGLETRETQTFNVFADDIANLTPVREYLAAHWPNLELPEDHPTHGSFVDTERIKRQLGWTPRYNVHRTYEERQAAG